MMNRPPIEEWLYNERSVSAEESVKVVQLGLYALDQERKNTAYDKANKDFQELLITAHKERAGLEARLKEAEEACGDAVVFIKAHCVDLMPFTAAHIAKKLEKALKDLGKDKP